ncbi:MAG: riboflavin synthase [Campylobacteraceae bacterium]|jgi:riboflavin synthase|nr:riboflavin synthase [Campylobacteraceae bacterium]
MFTGLVREIAKVLDFSGNILTIKAKHKPKIGDSICVNGACLTVISTNEDIFKVELSFESRAVLALENFKGSVHIEPSLKLGDGLEGHLVQGHIDGTGKLTKIEQKENSTDFYITIAQNLHKFMIPKGSVAIDGISLTINETGENFIRLTIISHTMKETLLHTYKTGRLVNIESDMIARYLYNLTTGKRVDKWAEIDRITAIY